MCWENPVMLLENCLNSHWVYVHICDWLRLFLEAENFLCLRFLEKKMVSGISSAFFPPPCLIGVWAHSGFLSSQPEAKQRGAEWKRGRKCGRSQGVLDVQPGRFPGCQFHHLWKGSREEDKVLNQVSQTVLSRKQVFHEILNRKTENI